MTTRPIVLLAEDELTHRRLFERNLMRGELNVDIAMVEDGEQTIEYLKDYAATGCQQPLILILDLNMPVMTGVQVLEWMRSDAFLCDIPVVVLTTSDEPYEVERCRVLGVEEYLIKPIKAEAMEAYIRAHMPV